MKFDSDRILALSAMFVGLASLVVVVYQAQLQREQMELERRAAAAAVMPYLMMNVSFADVGVAFNLRNAGLGPARIDRVRVLHKDSAVDGDAFDFYLKMRKDPNQPANSDPVRPGRLVSPGEWVQMIGSGGDRAIREAMGLELLRLFRIAEVQPHMYEAAKGMGAVFEEAVLEVTYSSLFGEQWVLRSDTLVPKPG